MQVNRPIPVQQIRLIVFDLDGTLVDSRQDLANSINAMLRHFHRPELPPEVIASYIGDGAPMLVRRSLGDPKDDHFLHVALQYFLDWYREHKLDTTYVYAGAAESLREIRKVWNGSGAHRMAVLSNKPVGPSRAIVEALGLGEFFFKVYGGNSFETKKPDPLGITSLLREAEVEPHEAVMVGDSDIDILTARSAGLFSVGCNYGLAPHTLEAAPPDVMVETPAEWTEVFCAHEVTRR